MDGELNTKQCGRCKEVKKFTEFGDDNRTSTGKKSWCQECYKKYRAEKIGSYEEKLRNKLKTFTDGYKLSQKKQKLKERFGLTIEEFNLMLAKQNNKCEICKNDHYELKKLTGRGLCVDHDHETGQIRDLLCSPCNLALGNFREDVVIINSSIGYVKKWSVV